MKYRVWIILAALLTFAGWPDGGRNEAVAAENAGPVIGAPAGLHLRIVENGFQLNWTLSPQDKEPVTGYEILRADRFSGPYDPVGTVGSGTSQYVDRTAAHEIIYFYKVRARAGKDLSDFSNTVTGER